MTGFTDKGLVILPKLENYNALSYMQLIDFKSVINKLPSLFKNLFNIDLYYFETNTLDDINTCDYTPILPICKEDLIWAKRNIAELLYSKAIPDSKFAKDIAKKYPMTRGLSIEDRYTIFNKREQELGRRIAESFKLVISFEKKSNSRYTPRSTDDDGRILMLVDTVNFQVSTFLSGSQIDITSLTNLDWTYKPITQWEVS